MAGEMRQLAETRIGKAIADGNIVNLKQCLLYHEDPLFKDRKDNTFLHYVCTMYRPHMIQILLSTPIDINAQNRHGNTALHVTALQDECGHVADLMAGGIDSTVTNKDNKTAAELKTKNKFWHDIYKKYEPGIFQAVAEHDVDRVLDLLHCWSKVDSVRNGQTLRQFAAALKFHDIVFLLDDHKPTMDVIYGVLEVNKPKVKAALKKSKCNVNYLNHASSRPHILQYAIRLRDVELVTMLCDAGADVNIPVLVNSYYWGPLYFEAINNRLPGEIVWKVLKIIKSKPDFSLKDQRGRNCMNFALDKTNGTMPLDVLAYMLKHGAYIAERDETGCTVRDVARFARRRDVVDLIDRFFVKILRNSDMTLLRKLAVDGYDSLMIQHNYRDTYIYACGNEDDEVLKFITWLPDFQKSVKMLHYSIRTNDMSRVRELLSNVENCPQMLLNARDKGGRTPLHLAVLYENQQAVSYLLSRPHLDLTLTDSHLRTVYHYACAIPSAASVRQQLLNSGVDTQLVDCKWKKAEDYQDSSEASKWLQREKEINYGMELELLCVDKYEELRKIVKSRKKTMEDFNAAIKSFKKYPVAKLSELLSPLMPDYKDLIFLALDSGKPDIAKRLADLGADLAQIEMYEVDFDAASETEDDESDQCSGLYPPVCAEVDMTPADRARYLGLQDLADRLDKKMFRLTGVSPGQLRTPLVEQVNSQLPSVFMTEDLY